MEKLVNEELQLWLKAHHKTQVWRVWVDVIQVWTVIGLAMWFGIHYSTWWSYLIAVFLIGSRQHALGTLVHDGTHFTLAKNRTANDFICDIFCAFPIFISTRGFRIFHITHHRYTRTDQDPEVHAKFAHNDYLWPKTNGQAFWTLFRDLVGINFLSAIGNIFIWSDIPSLMAKPKEHWIKQKVVPGIAEFLDRSHPKFRLKTSIKLRIIVFYALLFGAVTYFGQWKNFFFYWIVPMWTVLAFIIRLRGMSEHNGLNLETDIESSRTTLWPNPVFAYFITPFYVNYHLEHHLFPQVPYFHLKALHVELMKRPVYKEKAPISRNYWKNLTVKGHGHKSIS